MIFIKPKFRAFRRVVRRSFNGSETGSKSFHLVSLSGECKKSHVSIGHS